VHDLVAAACLMLWLWLCPALALLCLEPGALAPGKPGRGGSDVDETETSDWNPAGIQPRPAQASDQPEASLAWRAQLRKREASCEA
jgi:hypothetical protein